MKNKIIMYLVDNEMICFVKKENRLLIHHLPPKILKQGKIIHRPKFQKEFTYFLKKNKILKKFHKNIIYLITPPNFEEIDKEIFFMITEDLPIESVKYIKEKNLYQLKKHTLWINYNQNYGFLTMINQKKEKTTIWEENNEILLIDYIKKIIMNNNHIKQIILIGTNRKIPEYTKKLEQLTKKRVLYYENYDNFFITRIIRHNFF